jgi:hypothetical protein
VKLVLLPMATKLFMLGLPAHRDLKPSINSLQQTIQNQIYDI